MNIQFIFINKQMIDKLIKILYLNKFVIFYNIFKMKVILKYFIKAQY